MVRSVGIVTVIIVKAGKARNRIICTRGIAGAGERGRGCIVSPRNDAARTIIVSGKGVKEISCLFDEAGEIGFAVSAILDHCNLCAASQTVSCPLQ